MHWGSTSTQICRRHYKFQCKWWYSPFTYRLKIIFPCFQPQWAYVDEKEFVCLFHTFFAKPMHNQSLFSSTLFTCKPFKHAEKCISVSSFTAQLGCDPHLYHEELWGRLLANQFHFHLLPINEDPLVNSQIPLRGDHLIWNWGIYAYSISCAEWQFSISFFFFLIHIAQCYLTMSIFFTSWA